ncbi:MAG: 23S rRNA (adenine(2503)-C(2))-methyltransferase RlmN [Actinomycetia bacterium]|nr:23S rRNA (adenine(2503)-C(2))-methyltransferase RlmN [Actinomycetes bacterium]
MSARPSTLYDVDRAALATLLDGEPRYRLDQLWEGLYANALDPADISNLPKALRQRLAEELPAALDPAAESVADGGETVKFLWELHDGATVETVLMHYDRDDGSAERCTVCVSTQAGCAMACSFCATGQAGFERHLTAGEIVEQLVRAQRRANEHPGGPRRVSNVVFMGMGEPLANYDATWAALTRIHDDMGIGARRLTVSTVGLVPGIRRMASEDLPVNLAVSLHAADDELRDQLVPINRRWPIRELITACSDYLAVTSRRVSFEWALISEVNDRYEDADRLAALARPLGAHVNLIPLNPTPGYAVKGSSRNRVHRFRERLVDAGVNATIRDTRGSEIDAACGQLRAGHEATPIERPRRR